MLDFNSDNIFVGYTKELLHTFNLPKVTVVNPSIKKYYKNTFYLDGSVLYKQTETSTSKRFSRLFDYILDKPYLNITKTMNINNNTYDTYTHEYLGEYLRFLRDYRGVNLMPLYNCFSNNFVPDLHYNEDGVSFDTSDDSFKIFMIPVKFFQKYTLAIECPFDVEIMWGFYGKTYHMPGYASGRKYFIEKNTYKRMSGLRFSCPQVIDNSNFIPVDDEFKLRADLKMFIKIPSECSSSIVVLEGDYANWNDRVLHSDNSDGKHLNECNKSINNFKVPSEDRVTDVYNEHMENIPLTSRLQLLETNSGKNHPFADRLIEYLVGNVIDPTETISDNIKRLQKVLIGRKIINSIADDYGLWKKEYKNVLYTMATECGLSDITFDILGFCDKDIENKLSNFHEAKIYSEFEED